MPLLRNIVWSFGSTKYPTLESFNEKLTAYQVAILGHADDWHPEEVLVNNPKVAIAYEYWIQADHVSFDNETKDEDGGEQKEVVVTFSADNGESFTALELFYKLHERLTYRYLGDHTFFEGLMEVSNFEKRAIPTYYLRCGS